MAKIYYPPTVGGIIGTVNGGVYYRSNNTKFGYLRSWKYPKLTANNTEKGLWMKNARGFWQNAAAGYKTDFTAYGQLYQNLPYSGEPYRSRTASGFAIFFKALTAWAEDLGTVDLASLTQEDFELAGNKMSSVVTCVQNGYIPVVEGYEEFDFPYPFLAPGP